MHHERSGLPLWGQSCECAGSLLAADAVWPGRYEEIKGLKARDIMSTNPKTIDAGVLAVDALDFMQNHKITQLLVTRQGQYVGVIHLHNLIQEGII